MNISKILSNSTISTKLHFIQIYMSLKVLYDSYIHKSIFEILSNFQRHRFVKKIQLPKKCVYTFIIYLINIVNC